MRTLKIIFPKEDDLIKLLSFIYISDELKKYIRVCFESDEKNVSFESFYQRTLLNVCYHHIQNAYTLALLNKNSCIDLSNRSNMLFNIGLQDAESKDDIILVCVLNHGRYEFSKWMKRKNCQNPERLCNPLIVPESFWEAFKSEKCECTPTGHFLTDHNERLPKKVNNIDLLSALGKSWNRAVDNSRSIVPIVYKDAVQYAVPIFFDGMDDANVIAICQLVKKDFKESRFVALTKMTKDMVRRDMLLTIFDKEKNSWLNPASDNVLKEKCLVCLDVPKKKKYKQSIIKAFVGGVAPIVAGVALFLLKGHGKKRFF